MKKYLKILIALAFVASPAVRAFDRDGVGAGGGGSSYEARAEKIRAALAEWVALEIDGPSELDFAPLDQNAGYQNYVEKMLPLLRIPESGSARRAVSIEFISELAEREAAINGDDSHTVRIQKHYKECRSFPASENSTHRILCIREFFPDGHDRASADQQYRLLHHEFAVLAGVETNVGEASDFHLSNQLAEFTEEVVEFRLGAKRHRTISCDTRNWWERFKWSEEARGGTLELDGKRYSVRCAIVEGHECYIDALFISGEDPREFIVGSYSEVNLTRRPILFGALNAAVLGNYPGPGLEILADSLAAIVDVAAFPVELLTFGGVKIAEKIRTRKLQEDIKFLLDPHERGKVRKIRARHLKWITR